MHVESPATSLSLLERVRARTPDSWERLVFIYNPLLLAWLRTASLDSSSATDVSQEVWLSVAKALGDFRRDQKSGTFRGWLWTITRNKLNDLFRCHNPQAAGGTEAHRMFQELPEVEPADESGITENHILRRALELIRPDYDEKNWSAFWKMTIDGHSAAEVGQELGLTANAVHQAKFRILKRLRQEMAGLMEE